jgi:hypothetical protein
MWRAGPGVLGVASLLIAGVSRAPAQGFPRPDSSPPATRPRITAAGGLDLFSFDGSGFKAGYFGQLGLEWQKPDSKLGVRLHFTGFRRNLLTSYAGGVGTCVEGCWMSSHRSLYGVGVDVKYDLTKGRVRPYLFTGAGLYLQQYRREGNITRCDVLSPAQPCAPIAFSSTALDHALSSGFGVTYRLRGVELFSELRYFTFLSRGAGGNTLGAPLSIGIRFD